jgi:hypothetical protein
VLTLVTENITVRGECPKEWLIFDFADYGTALVDAVHILYGDKGFSAFAGKLPSHHMPLPKYNTLLSIISK